MLWSVLAVLVAGLLAFAIPLSVAVRARLIDESLDEVQATLEQVGLIIDAQGRTCSLVQFFVERFGDDTELSLWTLDGDLVRASAPQTPPAGDELATAARGLMGRGTTAGQLVVATRLSTGVCGEPLLLRATAPDDGLRADIRRAWVQLGLLGAGVLLLGAAAATWLGRRLATPLEALARSARRLGDGDFTARAPRSGLDEPDEIADALDATAERLGRAAQRSAAFTADASHQLRTPLTALRLQLEALEATGADAHGVADALAEADRLEATIDELVALTRIEGTEEVVDLGTVVAERLAPWRALAQELGRELVEEHRRAPPVRARPAALGQALQVLLDNAFQHGRGPVTVTVGPARPAGENGGGGARVCVRDEGPGIDLGALDMRLARDRGGGPLPVTGGRGLVLARTLVEAEGGRLSVEEVAGGTRACIVLPGTDVLADGRAGTRR